MASYNTDGGGGGGGGGAVSFTLTSRNQAICRLPQL
jgi:hypothetical protein